MLSTTFVGDKLTMKNLNTSNTAKTTTNGGGIYTKKSDSFRLQSSTFTSINYAEYGGAVYIDSERKSSTPTTATHSFVNVTFTGNNAYCGGALYINEVNFVTISNTTFSQNSATGTSASDGKGGGLYYHSSSKLC